MRHGALPRTARLHGASGALERVARSRWIGEQSQKGLGIPGIERTKRSLRHRRLGFGYERADDERRHRHAACGGGVFDEFLVGGSQSHIKAGGSWRSTRGHAGTPPRVGGRCTAICHTFAGRGSGFMAHGFNGHARSPRPRKPGETSAPYESDNQRTTAVRAPLGAPPARHTRASQPRSSRGGSDEWCDPIVRGPREPTGVHAAS